MKWKWGLLVVTLFPALAVGTTMIELPLEVMSRDSDLIIIGRCVGKTVKFNEDRTFIYTDYTFHVSKVIKGKACSRMVVRQPGGEIGDIGMRMVGTARFLPFEEALIFAGAEIKGARGLLGLAQGKFTVITDDGSGVKYAARDMSESILLGGGDAGERLKTPVPLDDLVQMIQAAASKEGK